MKSLINCLATSLILVTSFDCTSQILTANSAVISIKSGGIFYCNGGASLNASTSLSNEGDFHVTKNSTLPSSGNYSIGGTSQSSGSGDYFIEQDWINNAQFTANSSTVHFYGNTEQLITSTNGTITEFHNVVLSGNGTGNNRRKTLENVNSRIDATGVLSLNDREFYTNVNDLIVLNPSTTAITNTSVFGSEGFIASEEPGMLVRSTNSNSAYILPLGSSNGTLRYRPIILTPKTSSNNTFEARLDNYNGDLFNYFLAQHDSELETLNPLFFHSIDRTNGTSDADIEISYLSSTDGEWSSIGHWSSSQSQWNSTGSTNPSTIGNYSSLILADWNFSDTDLPFILGTVVEDLVIPNVFTPNNDGDNDTYFASGKGIIEFNMTIVNRWGNVMFESNDINVQWDGTVDGKMCSDGTYFYLINAKSNTKEYKKHGHLTLISGQ